MPTIFRLTPAMEPWRVFSILGPKMAHPMAYEWTRKEVAMANYLRKTISKTPFLNLRIRRTLRTTHQRRNQSECDKILHLINLQ